VGDHVYEENTRDSATPILVEQPSVRMFLKPEQKIPTIDKHDAEFFRSLTQFMWVQGEPVLLMYEVGHEIYTTQGLDLSALKHLEAAGLLSLDPVGYLKKWFGKHTRLFYFGKPTKIQFPQDANNRFDLGHVILTEKGKTLARDTNATRNQKFYEYTIESWFRQGLVTSSILPPFRSI
jgi:hypothetical protein